MEPLELKSAAASLERQPDGSILAGRPQGPDDERYSIVAQPPAGKIVAFRLEMLTHQELPQMGPGHHPSGNFKLRELGISSDSADEPRESVPIAAAAASFSWKDNPVAQAIDQDPDTTWHVWSQTGKPHLAVFLLGEPLDVVQGDQLTVELQQDLELALGRFRLSYVTEADVVPDGSLAEQMK